MTDLEERLYNLLLRAKVFINWLEAEVVDLRKIKMRPAASSELQQLRRDIVALEFEQREKQRG